ncbi:unnamed protein product [Prorocentrum cordatum]|uniref:DNA (cytosine-5-)-methyltransferase n=1 Tax=Prorocentrum cordatum TaxID=2364126 RepID=A0ABN9XPW8_9DINO|nr:unnamed protein product [Polarella glacialis]
MGKRPCPPKEATSRAKAKASPKVSALPGPPQPAGLMDDGDAASNAKYLSVIDEHVQRILSHHLFEGIRAFDPLQMGANTDRHNAVGMRKPIEIGDVVNAMTGGSGSGAVPGGGNIFRVMFNFQANPGVPISLKKVTELSEYHYALWERPGPPCLPIHAFLSASISEETLKATLAAGELKLTTPPESIHAWVIGLGNAIAMNRPEKDELKQWLEYALSAEFTFAKLESMGDAHFSAVRSRENLSVHKRLMGRTALGRILEVSSFKSRKEKLLGPMSSKAIEIEYKQHCNIKDPEEQVTANFVDNALTIVKRMLSISGVMTILSEAEDTCEATAFDSVSKLHAVVSKAKTPAMIIWTVRSLWDDHKSKTPLNRVVPGVRDLLGKTTAKAEPNDRVGKVEVCCFKHTVKTYLTSTWLDNSDLPSHVKESFRTSLSDHASYRASNGLPDEEALIYSDACDEGAIKPAIRAKKAVSDMLTSPGLEELMNEAAEDLQNEAKGDGCGNGDDEDGGDLLDMGEADEVQLSIAMSPGATANEGTIQTPVKKQSINHRLLLNPHMAPETVELLKPCDSETLDSVEKAASTLMRTHLAFVEDQLEATLEKVHAAVYQPVARKTRQDVPGNVPGFSTHVGVIYSVSCSGEAITNPKTRCAPYRNAHYKRLMHIALKVRGKACGADYQGINPADYIILFNGNKDGLDNTMMSAFRCEDGTSMPRNKISKMLLFDEETVAARMDRVRGTINQTETFNIVAADPVALAVKKKLHFPGTARGVILGPVALPKYDDAGIFKLTQAEKKILYDKHRTAVGGPTDDGPDPVPGKDERIPVFYKSIPQDAAEEIAHCLDWTSLVDLTPNQGVFAMVAIMLKLLWVGVTFNKLHADQAVANCAKDTTPQDPGKQDPKRRKKTSQQPKQPKTVPKVSQEGAGDKEALLAKIKALTGSGPSGSKCAAVEKGKGTDEPEARGKDITRLGGDCDGLCSHAVALEMIIGKDRISHEFASEIDQQTRAVMQANHGIKKVYHSCKTADRTVSQVPKVDVYAAGPPCQPFAMGGNQSGEGDSRGQIILDCAVYITTQKPACFVIEEAPTLMGKHRKTLNKFVDRIRQGAISKNGESLYEVEYRKVNSDDHGLPTTRARTYIVGWLRSRSKGQTFEWPTTLPLKRVADFIDPTLPANIPTDMTCLNNLARLLGVVKDAGYDLAKDDIILDVYQSENFGDNWQVGKLPTLTRTRAGAGGYYLTRHSRMMDTTEMLAIQGFPKGRLNWKGLLTEKGRKVTDRQFNLMIGNTMSVPVVGRLMLKLLILVGKLDKSTPDPWCDAV